MITEIFTQHFKTAYGELIIGDYSDQICLCDWRYRKCREAIDNRIRTGLKSCYVAKNTPLIDETINQLNDFFAKKRFEFDLPILFIGTDFQQTVWKELMKIPYGKTTSYLDIAERIGMPKAFRAVANANGANAISIIVPCHRVIGKSNNLVGYAGGINTKEKLLKLENEQLFSD
jgi:methylated-DNA-[protein]-cysteine S-methyltransferase